MPGRSRGSNLNTRPLGAKPKGEGMMATITYKGWTLEHRPIRVPGGNTFDAWKVLGTNIHASWETCKTALDKVSER